ncbi:DUF1428 domain-containing protein, partial [Vibrio parahaemolyticus]|nr:DUF1428 domain-containing protein [Vibrio parahaemolyticus]
TCSYGLASCAFFLLSYGYNSNERSLLMSYIDGFVAAVPTANKEKYIAHAKIAAEMFREFGALKVVETWGSEVPDGEITSFPMAVNAESNETVVFSWVVWPSKEVRDSGWLRIMGDPRMSPDNNPMPFDGKRLIYGGFDVILEQ